MSTINKDLGMVTAYAYAVAGGYAGTEEEFEQLLGSAADILNEFNNFNATAETLAAGSEATASYADGLLSLGIPRGDKGETGNGIESAVLNQDYTLTINYTDGTSTKTGSIRGATGATPDISIGTVTTLNAGDSATASMSGTAEEPVLSLGIPKGASGNTDVTAELFSASKAYAAGDFVVYNDKLYVFTAAHAAGAWTGSDATQTTAGSEIADLKEDLDYNLHEQLGYNIDINPSWQSGYWGETPSTTRLDYVRTVTGIYATNGDILDIDFRNATWERIQFNYYSGDTYLARTEIRKATITGNALTWTFANANADNVRLNIWSGNSSDHLEPSTFNNITILKNQTRSLKDVVDSLDTKVPLNFEYGNATYTNSSISFPITPTMSRIRTPINTYFSAKAGDVLHCSDYSNVRYYYCIDNGDGTYTYNGWRWADYTFENDCNFVVLARYNPEAEITDFDDLANRFWLIRKDGNAEAFTHLQDNALITEREFYRNQNVRGINHRGWVEAPENTAIAYKLSKQHGFNSVETDIRATSDGVLVCLHDNTVDRTSNGTGAIASMTLAQAQELDFGSYKSTIYAGEKILTAEDFLKLCKNIGLHPYLEMKLAASADAQKLVDLVESVGMTGKVTYIGSGESMNAIKEIDSAARLGIITQGIDESTIARTLPLKTDSNEVFINCQSQYLTTAGVNLAIDSDLPVEVWNVLAVNDLKSIDTYVTGISTDSFVADVELTKLYL